MTSSLYFGSVNVKFRFLLILAILEINIKFLTQNYLQNNFNKYKFLNLMYLCLKSILQYY